MKLSNIRKMGRFKNELLKKEVNIWKGFRKGYGTSHYFYYYRGKKVLIPQNEYFENWIKLTN